MYKKYIRIDFSILVLKLNTRETHFTRNKTCGGDESPDVASVFCTNDIGAQISGWYDSYDRIKVIRAYIRYKNN